MRILHTMIRIGNLDRSIDFYTTILGMRLFRREEFPDGKFTIAFVGYGSETSDAAIELTYNWGIEKYDLGAGFGHIAIEVPDAYAACEEARLKGATIIREAGPMKHGTAVIAFLKDPDGYMIEIIESRGVG